MKHKEYIPPTILFRLLNTQSFFFIISSHPQVTIIFHKRADDTQWHKGDSSSAAEQKQAARPVHGAAPQKQAQGEPTV